MIATERHSGSATAVAPTPATAKRPAATAPRPPFIARKEQAAQSSPPKRAAAKAKSEARESGGVCNFRLVVADGEAANRGGTESSKDEWFEDTVFTHATATVVLVASLNKARAYQAHIAVPVASIAAEFSVPVAALLAAAAGLRSEAFAVLRRDDPAGVRLWLADKSEVEAHARRLQAEANECKRRALDFRRHAAGMRG